MSRAASTFHYNVEDTEEVCSSRIRATVSQDRVELLSILLDGRRESIGLPVHLSFDHRIDELHIGEHVS